jgi:hypothetical protein
MIDYTPQSQLSLNMFKHPFERKLDKENRWVKLASLVPWDSLAAVYSRKLDAGSGRKSVNIRTVIAALIVKHKLGLDDRTIEMIQENIYLQYFCGLPCFTTWGGHRKMTAKLPVRNTVTKKKRPNETTLKASLDKANGATGSTTSWPGFLKRPNHGPMRYFLS